MLHTTWCSLALLECIFVKKREKRVPVCARLLPPADGGSAWRSRGPQVPPWGPVMCWGANRTSFVHCWASGSVSLNLKSSLQQLVVCRASSVFVRLCYRGRNPLNVSSSQSKRQGEPAWPAGSRWCCWCCLSKPLCVCARDYQFNLFVCVGTPS